MHNICITHPLSVIVVLMVISVYFRPPLLWAVLRERQGASAPVLPTQNTFRMDSHCPTLPVSLCPIVTIHIHLRHTHRTIFHG